jgi:hypothetical protein
MQVRDHRGFNIEVHKAGEGYISEIYRKGKLIHAMRDDNDPDCTFHNPVLAIEATREWINRAYPPGRIKYFGEV